MRMFIFCAIAAGVTATTAAPAGDIAGKYVGTFKPANATPVVANARVTADGRNYHITLTSRPDNQHFSGSQWRDYNLSGTVEHGRFHASFVSGQIVEPVTFSDGKLTAVVQGGASGGTFELHRVAASTQAAASYPAARIVITYRDPAGHETKPPQQFRIEDPGMVAKLAAQFPGIFGERGSGPRTGFVRNVRITICFLSADGQPGEMRVAHVSPDYSQWFWRDNPPYTGARQVKDPNTLRALIRELAHRRQISLE